MDDHSLHNMFPHSRQAALRAKTRNPEPENLIWVVPKIKGTLLGVPIIRTKIFWGLLGSPYFGKLPYIYIYIYGHIHIHIYIYIYIFPHYYALRTTSQF